MLIIAVDFDGTLVAHEYPEIGEDAGGAYWIQRCQVEAGAKVILWTMRSGEHLQRARDWCARHGIDVWGVNENPSQSTWSNSRKAYAHVYVDDAAFGCPKKKLDSAARPVADWDRIGPALLEMARAAKEGTHGEGAGRRGAEDAGGAARADDAGRGTHGEGQG